MVLAGAALDTNNLGVTALGLSTVTGLLRRRVSVTILDNSAGAGPVQNPVGWIDARGVSREGAWYSRKVWRAESLITMDFLSRVGATSLHPRLRSWQRSAALVDLSGGDSFSDIYGDKRFRAVAAPKLVATRLGLPVVLLPQTYGPFRSPKLRGEAIDVLRRARQCWARDEHSLEQLQALLESSFDSDRHRVGVDVAFALPRKATHTQDALLAWMTGDSPSLGINVSGLVASSRIGTSGLSGPEYVHAVAALVNWAISRDYKAVLIPHVVGSGDQSDVVACQSVIDLLPHSTRQRVRVLSGVTHPGEVKYVISNLAWFTGARMHSTIAALSSRVPTVATAYSDKFAGVFAMCGVPEAVIDLRSIDARELLGFWQDSVTSRCDSRSLLDQSVPSVVERADRQFDDILEAIGEM